MSGAFVPFNQRGRGGRGRGRARERGQGRGRGGSGGYKGRGYGGVPRGRGRGRGVPRGGGGPSGYGGVPRGRGSGRGVPRGRGGPRGGARGYRGGRSGYKGRGYGRGRGRGQVQARLEVEIFVGDVGFVSKQEFEININKCGAADGLLFVRHFDSNFHGFAMYETAYHARRAIAKLSQTYKNVSFSDKTKHNSSNNTPIANTDDYHWYFENDSKMIEKCDEWLSNQLKHAPLNGKVHYKVGIWEYTTVKNSKVKATQTNDASKTVRGIILRKSNEDTMEPPTAPKPKPNYKPAAPNRRFGLGTNSKYNNNKKPPVASRAKFLDEESNKIKALFRKTMPEGQYILVGIERINFDKNDSNKLQLNMYNQLLQDKLLKLKRNRHMLKKHNKIGRERIEKTLFHGTKRDVILKIKINGFNSDFSTTAFYGKGTYFARDARYSHSYCTADGSGEYCMLACLVLVGDYCIGKQSMNTAPFKADGVTQYDSLVNDVNAPSIFVITRDYHCIPSYLIKYQVGGNLGMAG